MEGGRRVDRPGQSAQLQGAKRDQAVLANPLDDTRCCRKNANADKAGGTSTPLHD